MRSWTPGHRRVPGDMGQRSFHKHVEAIARIAGFQMTTYVASPEEARDLYRRPPEWALETEGESVLLSIRFGTGPTRLIIDLTRLREVDLDAMQQFINDAFNQARSTVLLRDAAAREAEDDGDYSRERSSLSDPKITRKKRQSRPGQQHSQGLHDGHQDALPGDSSPGD